MPESNSPLNRSIGVSNLIRGLIALAAVLAVGAAVAAGRYGLAAVCGLFVLVAVLLGYWAWRARRSSDLGAPPPGRS